VIVGDACPTCGFGLFNYNSEAVGCKHGHRWRRVDGKPAGAHTEFTPVAYQPPAQTILEPADPSLRPFVGVLAAFVGGGLVSVLADLILR
jgi:hypothetical protein